MTEQTDAAEVEAALRVILARVRCEAEHGQSNGGRCVSCIAWARRVGVSQHLPRLLYALDAQIAAAEARGAERALREAAEAVERAEGPTCNQSETCHAADATLLRLRANAAAQVAPSRVPGEGS